MTVLYAQPYDITALGFYFKTVEEYQEKASALRNDFGRPVEEFEIQFIDGEDIDCQLFKALNINQCNFNQFFDALEAWEVEDKVTTIIAVGECGYNFDFEKDDPQEFEIDLYELDGLYDLAEYFVEAGVYGEISKSLEPYIDYETIARDLGMDYDQICINNTRYVYRMW